MPVFDPGLRPDEELSPPEPAAAEVAELAAAVWAESPVVELSVLDGDEEEVVAGYWLCRFELSSLESAGDEVSTASSADDVDGTTGSVRCHPASQEISPIFDAGR